MKTASLAVALALVAAIPALAQADGAAASVDDGAPAYSDPRSYLQLGGALGSERDGLWDAVTLDVGIRLSETPLWAHGQLAIGGATDGLFEEAENHGSFRSGRAGLEARAVVPGTNGMLGAYAGIDVGYRSLGFGLMSSSSAGTAIAVGRVGLDLGTRHVRLRPGIDAETRGGLALNAALAYQW